MPRSFMAYALIVAALLVYGCKKDHPAADTPMTGTWIKGANAGDTLYFIKDDNKNILLYNASFNAALPVFTRNEYSFVNGKLALKNFMTAGNDLHVIQSFHWVTDGQEFEVLGYELFPIMSSIVTRFTYKKIQ